jgi:inosine-uridine nucleoside N-ribohydrolase
MSSPAEDPLYVVAIGAITNIASAILIEPAIIERIVIVWLGGNALYWPSASEFNLKQDVPAARIIFDCGVPLVMVPCQGVTTHLLTTPAELDQCLRGQGALADYLVDIVAAYTQDHFAWSKVIWDIAAIAYLVNANWTPSHLAHSPILTDQVTWSEDRSRHLIRVVNFVRRDAIFRDVFTRIRDIR